MITIKINGRSCARLHYRDCSLLDLVLSYARLYHISVFKLKVNGQQVENGNSDIPLEGTEAIEIDSVRETV